MLFDFECPDHGVFEAWEDSRFCPKCGRSDIKKVFVKPPGISTSGVVDSLIKQQLDAAGLTNFTNRGGQGKVSRETSEAELKVQELAHRMPINTRGGEEAWAVLRDQVVKQYGKLGVSGVTGGSAVGKARPVREVSSRSAAITIMQKAPVYDPYQNRYPRQYHPDDFKKS